MITNPKASELLDAVIGFMETRVAPQMKDRDAFLARVAVNALNTIKREMAEGPAAEAAAVRRLVDILGHGGDFTALNAELCEDLRTGKMDISTPGVFDHLKASIIDQVKIDQPNYSGLKAVAP